MPLTTLKDLLIVEMNNQQESFMHDVESISVSDDVLNETFNNDYGSFRGPYFYCWSKHRVYYLHGYGGIVWCESAPRNPQTVQHWGSRMLTKLLHWVRR